ncbi:GntR family transcriptional regulator [Micromonospora echinaurantiaca]|uniref:GntR family transcriptional regulator n=1 Tax=Micromonospora echinaurantiaca TaxID=47857 RepID=UPI0037AA096E
MANRIKSGEFPPGSRLPSRAELCEQYEVSSFVADRLFLILKMHTLAARPAGVAAGAVKARGRPSPRCPRS